MKINTNKFPIIEPQHMHGKEYINNWNHNRLLYMSWDERRLEKLDLSEQRSMDIMNCNKECILENIFEDKKSIKDKIKDFLTILFNKIKSLINGYSKKE